MLGLRHTPSIAFRHLPPNSARFGYATEGALVVCEESAITAISLIIIIIIDNFSIALFISGLHTLSAL